VCDLAFKLGLSEAQFYERFDQSERAQLVATYRSQMDRETVMSLTAAAQQA